MDERERESRRAGDFEKGSLLRAPPVALVQQSAKRPSHRLTLPARPGDSLSVHPPRHDVPALHAEPCGGKDAQGVPHSPSVVVARRRILVPFLLQCPLDSARAGSGAPQSPRPRQHVLVQRRIFTRRDGVSQGVAQDGVVDGVWGCCGGGCHCEGNTRRRAGVSSPGLRGASWPGWWETSGRCLSSTRQT